MGDGGQLFHAWGQSIAVYRGTALPGGGLPTWVSKGVLKGCPSSGTIHSLALSPGHGDELICGTAGGRGLHVWQYNDLKAFNRKLVDEVADACRIHVYEEVFELGTALGEGAHGCVYPSVWLQGNGKKVAVKLFQSRFAESFRGEATALALTRHPNILGICGLCLRTSKGDLPGLVVDFLERGTLHDLVKSRGPGEGLALGEIKNLGQQIASALNSCHNARGLVIIHRDLKTDNSELFRGAAGAGGDSCALI